MFLVSKLSTSNPTLANLRLKIDHNSFRNRNISNEYQFTLMDLLELELQILENVFFHFSDVLSQLSVNIRECGVLLLEH
jgi:hypothetical protein